MNVAVKNLLAGFTVGSLALAGAVMADDFQRVIEIKAETGQDVNIVIDNDGNSETLHFKAEELSDKQALANKLSHLDDDTRDTLMQTLQTIHLNVDEGVGSMLEGKHENKVVVMHKGDGQLVKVLKGSDVDLEYEIEGDGDHHMIQKHIVIGDHHGVLKGHTSAIVGLIAKGEFSQDELDKIQAAVDAKR
jgi:hypothetical protein